MACKLTVVVGDPLCRFKGTANESVTLKVVATVGSARFETASYAGLPLITGASEEISFIIKAGSNDLSIVYTFSSPSGRAELREKCDGNTLLDDSISSLNNGKLYHVCGSGGAALESVLVKKAKPRKAAAKKAARKKKKRTS